MRAQMKSMAMIRKQPTLRWRQRAVIPMSSKRRTLKKSRHTPNPRGPRSSGRAAAAGKARILSTVIWSSQSAGGDSTTNANAVAPVARFLIMQILPERSERRASSAIQQFIYDRQSSKTFGNPAQDGEQAHCQRGEAGAPGGAPGKRTTRRI